MHYYASFSDILQYSKQRIVRENASVIDPSVIDSHCVSIPQIVTYAVVKKKMGHKGITMMQALQSRKKTHLRMKRR